MFSSNAAANLHMTAHFKLQIPLVATMTKSSTRLPKVFRKLTPSNLQAIFNSGTREVYGKSGYAADRERLWTYFKFMRKCVPIAVVQSCILQKGAPPVVMYVLKLKFCGTKLFITLKVFRRTRPYFILQTAEAMIIVVWTYLDYTLFV